uniref:Uncharacterized protein n=1 Tax=Rhizophagus irregularis (strain DAOM 181602 / DAOM 197198 / MUCL 43194) TaxID=747089 RepID=U9TSV7_RHIID
MADDDSDLNEEEEDSIATSEAGVATVFNITGWTNPRDCWNNLNTFFRSQYSFSGGGQGTTHFLIMLVLKKEENAWHKTL